LLLLAFPLVAEDAPQYGETIDVVRYVIPARVVDPQGRAIDDLTPADFTASIGGKPAVVESVEWLGSGERSLAEGATAAEGRLIVMFVQTDFARAPMRVLGQLRFNDMAKTILDMFAPEDWVAVVSQDSHMKVQCDFTHDRQTILNAIYKSIETGRRPMPPATESGPSLVRHLTLEDTRRASKPGAALRMLADALHENDGQKVVLIGGWGIGELVNRRVMLDRQWATAMELFRASRIPVITLNTGVGGELTYGLRASASETGGAYVGTTQDFPAQSMRRMEGVLAGYYELVLRVDAQLPAGRHRVELRTSRKRAQVLAAPLMIIRSDDPGVNEMVELPDPAPPPPPSTPSLYVEAMRKLRDGEPDAAEALLTQIIAAGNAPAESWYERALLHAARGELTEASADLRAYLERAPSGRRAAEAHQLLEAWR
jgi:hypothetical protein